MIHLHGRILYSLLKNDIGKQEKRDRVVFMVRFVLCKKYKTKKISGYFYTFI